MFGVGVLTSLIVNSTKLATLGIILLSAGILYFSKAIARLIENVYKAYKVEKANKQKELQNNKK